MTTLSRGRDEANGEFGKYLPFSKEIHISLCCRKSGSYSTAQSGLEERERRKKKGKRGPGFQNL
jgi:hypothetical protein